MSQPHVVIVGGGFAGINVAQSLRHAPVRITLVDRRNFHLFQLFMHLMYLVTFGNRALVLFQWGYSYITRNRSARLITERDVPESR